MRFWDHLEEMRKTLLRIGFVIILASVLTCFFHKPLISFLLAPLHADIFYLFSPLDGFLSILKVCILSGLLFSSPLWLLFLIQFISPALHTRERRLIVPFLSLSLLFIFLGLLFAYTITLPLVSHTCTRFNAGLGENLWGLSDSLHFTLSLLLGHALMFELYVGLLFLIRAQVLSVTQLRQFRRLVVVLILILAAILTPPDLFSQLLLALPLLLLYEGAILYASKRVS